MANGNWRVDYREIDFRENGYQEWQRRNKAQLNAIREEGRRVSYFQPASMADCDARYGQRKEYDRLVVGEYHAPYGVPSEIRVRQESSIHPLGAQYPPSPPGTQYPHQEYQFPQPYLHQEPQFQHHEPLIRVQETQFLPQEVQYRLQEPEIRGNEFCGWQKKGESEFDQLLKGQRMVRDGQEELRYGLDDLHRKTAILREELNYQLDTAKGSIAPESNNRYQVSNYGHDSGYGAPCYNIENLPAYDGLTSFEEWLHRCEQFFYIHNIPEVRKVELGGMNLFAVARHWHKQVMERCSRRFVWPTWDEYVYEMRLCSGMSNVLNHSSQVKMNVVVDEEGGNSLAPSWGYRDCGRIDAGYVDVVAQEPSSIVSQTEFSSSPGKVDLELSISSSRNKVGASLEFENEAKLLDKEELDADLQAMDEGMELPQERRVNVEAFCNLKAKEHEVPVECDAEFSVVNQKKMVSNGKSDELEVKNSDVWREVDLVVHCRIKEVKMQDKNVGSSVDISATVSNHFCKTIDLNHLEMVAVLGRKCLEDLASHKMLVMGSVSIVQGVIQWDFKKYKKKLLRRRGGSGCNYKSLQSFSGV